MRPYPTATQPQFKLNHKSGGRGKCAAHGEGETPAGGGKPSAAVCRQENLSENRRARFGQLRCPRLARPPESSANHAKRTARTDIRLSATSSTIQPLYNRFSTPHQPPSNHHSSASHQLFVRHPPRRLSATVLQPPDNHFPSILQPSDICRVPPVPLNRPRITRSTQRGRTPTSRQPHRQFNHYTTASQLRANCRKLQPIGNRPSTVTSTILQPPSNHQSSASRHLFVRHSAAPIHPPRTRTSPTLHTPPPHPSAAQTFGNCPSTTTQPLPNRLPTTTHTLIARASSHLPRQGRTSSSLPHRHQAQCPDPATATIPHCSPHCPLRTVLGANGESLQWLNNRQT